MTIRLDEIRAAGRPNETLTAVRQGSFDFDLTGFGTKRLKRSRAAWGIFETFNITAVLVGELGLYGNGHYLRNFFRNNLLGPFIQKPSCIAIVTDSANHFLRKKEAHLLPREPKKAGVKSLLENAKKFHSSQITVHFHLEWQRIPEDWQEVTGMAEGPGMARGYRWTKVKFSWEMFI